ncbi:MAG: hypothetical protein A3E19_01985 [Planctomycetes bacterium RIFCSPHIGHO2_12_FULL_52_36]|nr:MAG: hypothetical protein A3D89_00270 [Planctomycetes bacterium RIFCSPHIGHO2_02_FULL_52_58]OHB93056.1 MAG: hypothetical protein A3E19_01985 [Planctomycetes bacterium RIFCSPHIGHO2_12_FULL_52_36]
MLLVVAFYYTRSTTEGKELYQLKVAGKVITVELARTPSERGLGLMYRRQLPEDYGMLFVFPEEDYLTFWMKNTHIPLSIAFISTEGTITQIESMEPLSLSSHDSKEKARYALEMLEGWFERHNVKVGDKVELPPERVSSRQ